MGLPPNFRAKKRAFLQHTNFLWTLGFCLLGVSLPLFLFIFNFVWHSVDRIVLNVNCWSTQQYFLSGSFQNLEIFLPGGASVFFPFKTSAFGCWPLLPPAGRIGNLCWLDELLAAPATCWQHRESLLDLPIWGEGGVVHVALHAHRENPDWVFPRVLGLFCSMDSCLGLQISRKKISSHSRV